MTQWPHTTEPDPTVLVLTSGTFGTRVGERLRVGLGAAVQAIGPHGSHPSLWPHADVLVLASGYEQSEVAKSIDRIAFAWRRPWFPVYSTATSLYCGPAVRPGYTACYLCFVARRQQHIVPTRPDAPTRYEVEVAHPLHHVGIAAAMAQQAISEVFAGPPSGSLGATVRTFDQVSGATSAHPVVAVDRCARCRSSDPEAEEELLWQAVAAAAAGRPTSAPSRQEAMQP